MSAGQAIMLVRITVAASLALLLAGCVYDYAQHTDRVGFTAGNAVKANLEAQTVNPSDKRRYKVDGLGKDGVVVPAQ